MVMAKAVETEMGFSHLGSVSPHGHAMLSGLRREQGRVPGMGDPSKAVFRRLRD